MSQQISLNINNKEKPFLEYMQDLLVKKEMVDTTLVCTDGEKFVAHQLVLAYSSPVFDKIFKSISQSQCFIVLPDISKEVLVNLLELIYKGHVNVPNSIASVLLEKAQHLKIRGLKNDDIISSSNSRDEVECNLRAPPSSVKKELTSQILKEPEKECNLNVDIKEETSCKILEKNSVSGKVLNPFAKMNKNVSKNSDSDSTFIDDKDIPGPSSKQSKRKRMPKRIYSSSESDVEIIECNQKSSNKKQALGGSSLKKRKGTGSKQSKLINNSISPIHYVNEDKSEGGSSSNENNQSKILKRVQKYNEFIENLPYGKLNELCVRCLKFKHNIKDHIKTRHKKFKNVRCKCKKCHKMFNHKNMLKCHKCTT